ERFSYFRYRTHFLLYRGRYRWLSGMIRPEGKPLGDPSREEEQFKLAYQDFELARGRLEASSSRTFLAQIDLAAAECALAHAGCSGPSASSYLLACGWGSSSLLGPLRPRMTSKMS